jgi:alpha-tubulin suppressor-like RCC1 family protein
LAKGTGADTYLEWKARVFTEAEQADPSVSRETALSPAGDGIPNLLKYAFGIDPHLDGSLALPKISTVTVADSSTGVTTRYPVISYQRPSGNPASDLYFVPEASIDLQTWVRGDTAFDSPSTENGGDSATISIPAFSPVSTTPTFLRLRVIEGQTLPEDWQQTHFGVIGVDPNDDPDGDGKINFDEFLHGTDPNDYYEGRVPTLEMVSGDGQRGAASSFLPNALVVRVTYQGNPLVNAPVRFYVSAGDATVADFFDISSARSVIDMRTGPDGTASAHALVGTTPAQIMTFRASSGAANPVTFTAKAYLGFSRYVAAAGEVSFTGDKGTLWAWGNNWVGLLADGTTDEHDQPEQCMSIDRVVVVAAADDHVLGLKEDGTVWSWGANWNGQLGDGTLEERDLPVQVIGLTDVVRIAAADSGSMALKEDGTVWTWGTGGSYVLGTGSTDDSPVPVQVVLENGQPLTNVIAIAAGSSHRLAATADGKIWAWGANWTGQLGDGTTDDHAYPIVIWTPSEGDGANKPISNVSARSINGAAPVKAVDLKAGIYHSLALLSDGTVVAWGANWDGGLGTGDFDDRWSPTPALVDQVTAIAAGDYFSLAIRSDGSAWAWGDDGAGQLGRDPYTTDWSTPAAITGLTDVISIAGGGAHTLALGNEGQLWAIGSNAQGQLGTLDFAALETIGTPVEAAMDFDRNGLVDSWERSHFGSTGHNASADDDGDGLTNAQEYALGTDPDNPDSDQDGTPDGGDGWPLNKAINVPPVPSFPYAVLDISGTKIWGADNSAEGVIEYLVHPDADNGGFIPTPNGYVYAQDWYNDNGQILARVASPRGVFHAGIAPEQDIFVLGDTDESFSVGSDPCDINNHGEVLLRAHLDGPDRPGENLVLWKDGAEEKVIPRETGGRLNDDGDILVTYPDTKLIASEGETIALPVNGGNLTNRFADGSIIIVGTRPDGMEQIAWHGGVTDEIPHQGSTSVVWAITNNLQMYGQSSVQGSDWGTFWRNGRAFKIDTELLKLPENQHNFLPTYRLNERGMFTAIDLRTTARKPLLLMPVDLLVDGNRDGQMSITDAHVHDDDLTSKDKPYRFWINDDDDTEPIVDANGDSLGFKEDDTLPVPARGPDSALHKIVSKRNLEDFARLWLCIPGLYSRIQSGEVRIALHWKTIASGSPSINIYPSADEEGSESYLTSDTSAAAQTTGVFNEAVRGGDNSQTIMPFTRFIFKSDYWGGLDYEHPKKCFLFEGVSEGKGELEVEFLDQNSNIIGHGGSLWLDLKNIKKMYQRIEGATEHPWPAVHFEPDPNEDKDNLVVFVHGWRMSPDGAGNYAETMFKRFWHRGFQGRFAAYHWDTWWHEGTSDWLPIGGDAIDAYLAHFNDSEHIAWGSADLLASYVNNAAFSNKAIIAHSMGNVVVGAALLKGMAVNNYAMLNAAVPASCYDSDEQRIRQTVPYRIRVDPLGLISFNMWDSASPDADSDPYTRGLSYRGTLEHVGERANLINFYLPNDFATSVAWEVNNDQTKPPYEDALLDTSFQYTPNARPRKRLWKFEGDHLLGYLSDKTEAMPYACRSWGKALGAWGSTEGAILRTNAVDLDQGLFSGGFDTNHNAEFGLNSQQLWDFNTTLMDEAGIPHNQ